MLIMLIISDIEEKYIPRQFFMINSVSRIDNFLDFHTIYGNDPASDDFILT